MSQESQQAISHVLQQDSKSLQTILTTLKQLKHYEKLLANYIDKKLATHCQVVNFENNCLVVITDSALWATQFRFQIPNLLPLLQQHPELYQLRHINCKIRPKASKPAPTAPQPLPRLSLASSKAIIEIAQTIQDARLKLIMLKLAKHTEQMSD